MRDEIAVVLAWQSLAHATGGQTQRSARRATTSAATAPCTATTAPKHELVDVDANFLHDDLRADVARHIEAARSVGVTRFVTPACTLRDCDLALRLAREWPGTVFVTAGVHPYWAAGQVDGAPRADGADFVSAPDDGHGSKEALRARASDPLVRCIGECGLDSSRGFPPLTAQLPWFEAQVELACETRKPLFLHERGAFGSFCGVLDQAAARYSSAGGLPPVVVHCFTGNEAELAAYRKRYDAYIGVTGFMLANKQHGASLGEWLPQHVPLDRLLVETDAPYMGFKGCRKTEPKKKGSKYPNVPAALPQVAAAVAGYYGVPLSEIAARTTANAYKFFGMEDT